MASLFSLPLFPNATQYIVNYSDPISGNPNSPNPLGPWTAINGGATITNPSDIIDTTGNQNLRLYQAAPVVSINGTSYTYPFYPSFNIAMSEPGVFQSRLYDAAITAMLTAFRDFINDRGIPQSSSTVINMDSGAGSGLLQPDGTTTSFFLADIPDATPAIVLENSVSVVVNGTTNVLGTDYWVQWDAGQVNFATAPAANAVITITYREVNYTNGVLNAALAMAIERLGSMGISGYGTHYDNNVVRLTSGQTPFYNQPPQTLPQNYIGDQGLRYIVLYVASKILNNAEIWLRAKNAREYKSGDFSYSTVPQRVLEGMSQQTNLDYGEIKDAAYRYIRTNTKAVSFGDYDSFLSINGLLPSWSALYLLNP